MTMTQETNTSIPLVPKTSDAQRKATYRERHIQWLHREFGPHYSSGSLQALPLRIAAIDSLLRSLGLNKPSQALRVQRHIWKRERRYKGA